MALKAKNRRSAAQNMSTQQRGAARGMAQHRCGKGGKSGSSHGVAK
jgi:hypothetical protein